MFDFLNILPFVSWSIAGERNQRMDCFFDFARELTVRCARRRDVWRPQRNFRVAGSSL